MSYDHSDVPLDPSTEEPAAVVAEPLPEDARLEFSRLPEDQQAEVLGGLDIDDAAEFVERLPWEQTVDVVAGLPPEFAADLLEALPSDTRADVINELEKDDAEAILEEMDPEEAESARELAQYSDDVAGGLMITELVRYDESSTVQDVIDDMRENADRYRDYDVQYAFIVDADERLTGVLRLRDLLLSRRAKPVLDLMIRNPLAVRDDMTLEELETFFDEHNFIGVPAVDGAGRMLGVVRASAVEERLGERKDLAYLNTQGLIKEEVRSMPLFRRSSRRLAWLSVNIFLNIIAASVIALYQDTLASVIALAVFLPIISDMSGCSGNQAVAVSGRELALGLVRPAELMWVWGKELAVGLINGSALGLLIGIVAYLWKGNVFLGLVVGSALFLNTVVAVSIGGLVPLILKRFDVDPAVASGPILTTVTDMCGFFFVLGLATLLLSKLV
ncbi:magnesium transporter [Stratiformator vulcanicus]|uniref:Magnesium transporter MgtE n=1 Tax=Stratiformator vulcanicus TaxID=2527980 RepID=A0A517R4K0_9PLAN|nr:magnesium transporter [Stratiformator vulcanicus]QDT38808.1 Magnesium transporter MgtE [Stratiformator vulcanicus]